MFSCIAGLTWRSIGHSCWDKLGDFWWTRCKEISLEWSSYSWPGDHDLGWDWFCVRQFLANLEASLFVYSVYNLIGISYVWGIWRIHSYLLMGKLPVMSRTRATLIPVFYSRIESSWSETLEFFLNGSAVIPWWFKINFSTLTRFDSITLWAIMISFLPTSYPMLKLASNSWNLSVSGWSYVSLIMEVVKGLIFLYYFTEGRLHLQGLIMLLQSMQSVTFLFLVEAHTLPVSMIYMCLICKL